MRIYLYVLFIIISSHNKVFSQCFATAGNPVGGTENIGNLDKSVLRFQTLYRHNASLRYFEGYEKYKGEKGILNKAVYNYTGILIAYGIKDNLSVETEGGYFLNKSQHYKLNDYILTGKGLSNIVLNIKPRLWYNISNRIEWSASIGINIPFSTELQSIDGVTMPIDVQPSTGSYGIVLQSFFIKENSFEGWRIFLVNRVEKYFENKNDFIFGTLYYNSVFFSRHWVFEKYKVKDWTGIIQLKNVIKERNIHKNNIVNASGNIIISLVPQVNVSLAETWNISTLIELPVYQHYNEIQLGNTWACSFSIVKDIILKKRIKK